MLLPLLEGNRTRRYHPHIIKFLLLFFLGFFIGVFFLDSLSSSPVFAFPLSARRYQMWSRGGKFSLTLKELKDFTASSFPSYQNSCVQDIIDVSSSSDHTDDENDQSNDSASKQLVLYDPLANSTSAVELAPAPLQFEPPLSRPRRTPFVPISSVLPSIGAFTVQCANCFKWRLIPTKEKYEEIREHILELPFVCETAHEWRPDVSCDDPEDISQDGSKLWAIDKPNIAQPPPGWERLLRIRGEGSTKFADIYYVAPSGKRLRSMVEIQKYLLEHPEYIRDGVTLSRFSFQIPRPLQENYVRKRPAQLAASYEGSGRVEPEQVNPLAWVCPNDCAELQHGSAGCLTPGMSSPASDSANRPVKKQATESSIRKHV